MRNLFWRGLAVALAAVVAWLLWTWPAEPGPQVVEFTLGADCTNRSGEPRTAEYWARCEKERSAGE